MTNKTLWLLIRGRTKSFYDRIFKPFGLCKNGEYERIENELKNIFAKKRQPSLWALSFLSGMDDAETEIALHKRVPESFVDEMESLCLANRLVGIK